MLRSNIQVRETIELLCRILAENGTTPIRAEILRKAKFDSLEEVGLRQNLENEYL